MRGMKFFEKEYNEELGDSGLMQENKNTGILHCYQVSLEMNSKKTHIVLCTILNIGAR